MMMLLLVCALPVTASDISPNVILIMTDDQGYPDISCHGNPVIRTPHMDQLAASGIQFTDFHVNPFCSPTRAALLTGRMSDRTGVTSTNTHRNYMRRQEVLMSEYFKVSGYRTGIFGKWHVGANYPYRPIDRGFDEWLGLGNNGLATSADLWGNDRMNDTYWHNGKPAKRKGFCTDVYFDAAMAFMRKSKQMRRPFFTYVATNVPHWDWNVPSKWLRPYLSSCSRERAAFYASISRVDWNLGRLIAFLDKEQLSENTILVFLTDNGSDVPNKQTAYTAGMRGFKGARYEGGHRVPCFMRAPEALVGKARAIDAFCAHIDLLPTFIDLCALKKPRRELLPLDGRSLRPLLTGSGDWPERMIVMHHHNGRVPQRDLRALVMTSQWRLIVEKPDQKEFYQIQKDRAQQHNVVQNFPEVVNRLEADYHRHWETLHLDRPLPRPVLGANATIRLSPDITKGNNPITQQAVRQARSVKPVWLLHVEQAGRFRFEVRRWPREVTAVLGAGLPPTTDPDIEYIGHQSYRIDVPGVALDVAKVELKLNQMTLSKAVTPGAQGVFFDVDLPIGPVDVEAWLIGPDGKRLGAYFVYADQL